MRILALLLAFWVSACGAQDDGFANGTAVLEGDGKRVEVAVEIAESESARAKGLMFREKLDDGRGMVFTWPAAGNVAMWMKNTKIPLDMVFAREGVVVGVIAWAKPMDETPLNPGTESDFVLEVPGGYAQKTGIASGWKVTLRRD